MTKVKQANMTPLEDIEWFINELKKEVNKCNAVGMASRAAGSFANIEEAFHNKVIDEDRMVEMKDEVEKFINHFNQKCKCQQR